MPACVGCSLEVPVTDSFCPRCGTPNPEAATIPTPTGTGRITERIDPDELAQRLQRALGKDFTVLNFVGEGGFAVVFAALERKLSRRIAIKVLRPEFTASRNTVQRFVREAESAANLSHPHILPIFFVGEGEGLVYFGMPLVQGETLEARLSREGQLPQADVRRMGAEMADALGEAHAAGLVHRDVKPANVLLQGGKQRVLVADFGIAKAAGSEGTLTGSGVIIGSPQYMSPEQASGSQSIDHRSDIYSLGVVLWQMLAGAVPFEGPDSQGVLLQHITMPLPPLRGRRRDVEPLLAQIVARCTAKRADDRFQTAAELAEALRGGALPSAPKIRRGRVRLTATLVMAGVVLAGGVFAVIKWTPGGSAGGGAVSGDPAMAAPRPTGPRVAVLPFEGADTGQSRLAARQLAARLGSQFGVATIDMNRLLPQWISERRSLTAALDSNANFAFRLGANQLIIGNVLESGRQLSVAVDVYDAQDYSKIGNAEVEGSADSLITLLNRVAGMVALSLCKQPEFNPGNLCFDVPARPLDTLLVALDGELPAERQTIHVLVGADGSTRPPPRPAQAAPAVFAAAFSAASALRFQPARKGGRPVESWATVAVAFAPRADSAIAARPRGAAASDSAPPATGPCAEWRASLANEGQACYDARPAARTSPVLDAPAACRATPPRRVVIVVRVSAAGAVVGSPFVQTRSECPAFDQAASALAMDAAFTPARKNGAPVEAWHAMVVMARSESPR